MIEDCNDDSNKKDFAVFIEATNFSTSQLTNWMTHKECRVLIKKLRRYIKLPYNPIILRRIV